MKRIVTMLRSMLADFSINVEAMVAEGDLRFANGKIVESWAVRDDLGTLRQLGRLPAIGPDRPATPPKEE